MMMKMTKSDIIKTIALSLLFTSFAVLLILIGIIIFAIFAAQKFGDFLKAIPLSYTITYGVFATALTYIRRKYK